MFCGVVLVLIPLHELEVHRVCPHTDLSAQTVKILMVFCGLQTASVSLNIIKAFRRGGILSRWDIDEKV
jgi:hypothetical protein